MSALPNPPLASQSPVTWADPQRQAAFARWLEVWTGGAINTFAVFAAGMVLGPSILAVLVIYGLGRTYRNMSPIEDMPR